MRNAAYLYDRGGENLLGTFSGEQVKIDWGRTRDDVSEANVTIRVSDAECRSALSQARTVRHELVIERDGKRVWEGPIIHLTLAGGGGVIRARDPLFFTQRTVCKQRWKSSHPHIETTIARTLRILRKEMLPWEAAGANFLPHIDSRNTPTTSKTSRDTKAYSQYVWDDMDSLAQKSGMDYTMVGRSLILHDTHEFIAMGRRLTDKDFLKPLEVSEYGVELARTTFATDNNGRAKAASVQDTYYGPVELLASSYSAGAASGNPITDEELLEQAKLDGRARYPTPVTLRVPENSQLAPGVVDELLPYLVPGTGFPVYSDSSLREIYAIQKLDKVRFTETSDGEICTVSISSAPVGSELVEEEDTEDDDG